MESLCLLRSLSDQFPVIFSKMVVFIAYGYAQLRVALQSLYCQSVDGGGAQDQLALACWYFLQ